MKVLTQVIDGVLGVARVVKHDKGKLAHEPDVPDAAKATEKVLDIALVAPRRQVADVDLVAAHDSCVRSHTRADDKHSALRQKGDELLIRPAVGLDASMAVHPRPCLQ